ncbi:MAG: hypothetical protein ACTSUE_05970 [Promethearchaeota archaeon]
MESSWRPSLWTRGMLPFALVLGCIFQGKFKKIRSRRHVPDGTDVPLVSDGRVRAETLDR